MNHSTLLVLAGFQMTKQAAIRPPAPVMEPLRPMTPRPAPMQGPPRPPAANFTPADQMSQALDQQARLLRAVSKNQLARHSPTGHNEAAYLDRARRFDLLGYKNEDRLVDATQRAISAADLPKAPAAPIAVPKPQGALPAVGPRIVNPKTIGV